MGAVMNLLMKRGHQGLVSLGPMSLDFSVPLLYIIIGNTILDSTSRDDTVAALIAQQAKR